MLRTKLKVRTYPDPVLRKKSTFIKEVGPAERMIIGAMISTMYVEKGIGLAAPQVGINQRLLVIDIGDGPIVIINPKITKKDGTQKLDEGCLSVPGMEVVIERAKKIEIEYLNQDNEKINAHFEDLMARVVQHEMDHLDGKLIVDYMTDKQKEKYEALLKKKSS